MKYFYNINFGTPYHGTLRWEYCIHYCNISANTPPQRWNKYIRRNAQYHYVSWITYCSGPSGDPCRHKICLKTLETIYTIINKLQPINIEWINQKITTIGKVNLCWWKQHIKAYKATILQHQMLPILGKTEAEFLSSSISFWTAKCNCLLQLSNSITITWLKLHQDMSVTS